MTTTTSRSLPSRIVLALEIRAGEGRRVGLLFLHLLLASSIFVLGRTVRDTLFLSRYSIAALPWMFVAYGVASSITAVLYARVADRLPRHRLVMSSAVVVAVTYAATWMVVREEHAFIYPVFYVWAEVAANLLVVQMWTLANDLFDARSARRLFPTIGAARILGVVLIGLVSGAAVRAIGTAQLLLVLVGLVLLVAVVAWRIGPPPVSPVRPATRQRGGPPRILSDPHVRGLAVMILVTFTALTIGDYQFKKIARATFQEDDLAAFFSLFYAGTGIVSFLFQIFATPRLLRRFGVGLGMAVMPTVFGGGSALLLGVPHLGVATAMKFADNGFQYTIHDTSLQALYAPFPGLLKARTRAFLEAVVKPISYGLGGLALVGLASRVDVVQLSWLSVGLVAVWLGTIPFVRRRYLAALSATLRARGAIEPDVTGVADAEAHRALQRILEGPDERTARVALEMLEGRVPESLLARVEALAASASPELRAEALRCLPRLEGAHAIAASGALTDAAAIVRAAGAEATAKLLRDDAADRLAELFDDPDRRVRVAALAGVLGAGGVEGAVVGGARLGKLLHDPDPVARAEAAEVLHELGRPAVAPVRALLADPDPRVRRAALRAAAAVADARLVPVLLDALASPGERGAAARALVAVGAPAAGPLLAKLSDPETPRVLRLELPRILRRLPSRAAYEGLHALAWIDDDHVRLRILGALGQLRATLALPPEPLEDVEALVERELRSAYRLLGGWEVCRERYGRPLLEVLVATRQERCVRRLLRILELRHDRHALSLVRTAIEKSARRANAIEVLDTLLPPSLRATIVPYLDDVPAADKLARAGSLAEPSPDPETFLLGECHHANPWAAAVALDALGAHPSPRVAEVAGELGRHRDPLVREQALVTAAVADEERGRALAAALSTDPDPVVARRARSILTQEAPMRSTLEKVLLLKAAVIFRDLLAEDLAPLARVAEEEAYGQGTRVFQEGELGDTLYVILSGRVRILRAGRELAVLGPGEAFGEMAVLDAAPRSATAETLEPSELLVIGSEEFYEVLREQAELAEALIKMLSARLRESNASAPSDRHSIEVA